MFIPSLHLLSILASLKQLSISDVKKIKATLTSTLIDGYGVNPAFNCAEQGTGIFEDTTTSDADFVICYFGVAKVSFTCISGYHYDARQNVLCQADPCEACWNYTTPESCVNSPHQAAFCFVPGNFGARCDFPEFLIAGGCPPENIYVLDKTEQHVTLGRNVPRGPLSEMTLIPGERKNVTLTFVMDKYPLDLYLLLDTSASMSDDKNSIVSLSRQLMSTLAELTDDYTLGFGAYSDKCDGYNYRNILPLTHDTSSFASVVKSVAIQFGCDEPEDAGTALAQVAICTSAIGWRASARKIVMLMTDATFHWDGYTSGYAPFDGGCHLDGSGAYTERKSLDYPSLDQVAQGLKDQFIAVIFGTTPSSKTTPFYDDFVTRVPPSSVGALNSDSSNMIQLIKDQYAAISSTIHLADSGSSANVTVRYFSDCGSGGVVSETASCSGLAVGSAVNFTVEIGLSACPSDPALKTQAIAIKALGVPQGLVQLPLQSVCAPF